MPTKTIGKVIILVILGAAFTLFTAQQKSKQSVPAPTVTMAEEAKPVASSPIQNTNKSEKKLSAAQNNTSKAKEKQVTASTQKLPRLVDLGAEKCIPCKMMVPVLEDLRNEYNGKLQVEFIDVWKARSAGNRYGIQIIPTQIFFDPAGKELFRHVGFISKEDILSRWKELGFNLTATQ